MRTKLLLQHRRVPNVSSDDLFPQAAALQPALWAHLQGYQAIAEDKGQFANGEVLQTVPALLCNLAQNPLYFNQLDSVLAPTLLRNTVLFDLMQARLLEVYPEHFLIMGYPAPVAGVPDDLSKVFPFPELIGSGGLSAATLRILTGNGMHLSSVGAALTFMFCTACPVERAS